MSSASAIPGHANRVRIRALAGVLALTASVVTVLPSGAAWAAEARPIASDSFERNVPDALGSAPVGGQWTVSPAASSAVTDVRDGAWIVDNLQPSSGAGGNLSQVSSLDTIARSKSTVYGLGTGGLKVTHSLELREHADGSGYRARVRTTTGGVLAVSVSRTAGSTETVLGGTDLPATVAEGQAVRLEGQVTGTNPVKVQVRAWLDGVSTPSWQYEYSDFSSARISTAGAIGMLNWSSSSSAVDLKVWEMSAETLDGVRSSTPASSPAPSVLTGKPNASNTGVPAGTKLTRYTGPLVINQDGTVIDGKEVYGDLLIRAKNVVIRNSYLHCGADYTSYAIGCVEANSGAVYNLTVERNLIKPDRPTATRDGIVGHEFTARYNHIVGTSDGIGIFNKPGGAAQANVRVEGNYIHDLTHWNTSPYQTDGTHNDGIEIQGGENIYVGGNTITGSVVAGDGLGKFGRYASAALIVTQNVTPVKNLVIEKNWLDGGGATVRIQQGKFATVALTFRGNFFGRDRYVEPGNSMFPVRIDSKSRSTIQGLFTNVWIDTGQALAEGKDLGIRYNGA